MAERLVPFALDEYFHIYNRGNSKQVIYSAPSDYVRFMQLLYLSNGTKSFKIRELAKSDLFDIDMGDKQVSIGAYCLMPNHFHILLKPLVENGVTTFMKKVSTGYSMYFNKKYTRTGGLFEGKFKSRHADSDEYLKYLFSYIHLNPLKLIQPEWKDVGLANVVEGKQYLDTYPYSSYYDFTKKERHESVILNKEHFPEYFVDEESFLKNIQDWLMFELIPQDRPV